MQTVIFRSCICGCIYMCPSFINCCTNHAYGAHVFVLFMRPMLCHHMSHRARYVRAGCPLAVGSGCSRTSDFLLLSQQLAMLLLSVLHVDQQ